jgi:hypothetical protein
MIGFLLRVLELALGVALGLTIYHHLIVRWIG